MSGTGAAGKRWRAVYHRIYGDEREALAARLWWRYTVRRRRRRLSAAQFEAAYAERSSTTAAQLHAWGRYAEPCDCREEGCEGWAMGHQWEDALLEDSLRAADAPIWW